MIVTIFNRIGDDLSYVSDKDIFSMPRPFRLSLSINDEDYDTIICDMDEKFPIGENEPQYI